IKNWNGKYEGAMTMRMALAKSRNIPALKALQAVGKERARQFANKLGMGFDSIYESYAIGGLERGVSPLQMAGAYSAFGNNGVYIKPHAVTKIVFPDNTEMDLTPKPKVAMKDYTAYMITDMLKTVVQSGTGTLANVPGLHVAGKTGTTNYSEDVARHYGLPDDAVPDSWFVGYTPNYTAAVWTGFSKKSGTANLSVYEQKIPRLLFKKVISHVDHDSEDFPMPKSVVKLPVKKGSNPPQLAGPFTPKEEIVYECFVRGSEPTETATDDKPLAPTNVQATYDSKTDAISLTWQYDGDLANVAFEVQAKNDKGESAVLPATGLSLTINHPTKGAVYTFDVYTVSKDGQTKSEQPATVTVQVPGDQQQTTPPEEQNGNNNGTNNGNGSDNNGNNNGESGSDNTNNGGNNPNGGQNNSGDGTNPPPTNPTTPPTQNNGNNSTGNTTNRVGKNSLPSTNELLNQ
ncbi:MAG: penicillin-binding protein, partial [Anoxybacillus sp.]